MFARGTRTSSLPVRALRPLSVAVVLVLAGCSGTLVEFTAAPATIPAPALDAQGYVHGNTTALPITYRVGPPGFSQDVTAETWMSGYSKTTADNETAVLLLYSSPDVTVEGTSVNPLRQLSNRELVTFVLDRTTDLRGLGGVEDVTDLQEVSVQNVTVLGASTELVSYAGRAAVDGQSVAVVVNVAIVSHEGDVVVALGVHEETVDERAAHVALVERIVHTGADA
jgi:hypothetical protein